jgi:hypothetical protein
VDYGRWRLDERPHPRPAVQGPVPQDLCPDIYRGHREVSGLGHDPGHWAGLRQELRAFGDKVFDVIEAEPDRLREVDGIGPVRASRIDAAWAEQKVVRETSCTAMGSGLRLHGAQCPPLLRPPRGF